MEERRRAGKEERRKGGRGQRMVFLSSLPLLLSSSLLFVPSQRRPSQMAPT
jgi:hypothetical protein